MATFAERLRYYREKSKYSQKELADIIGVSVAAYNKYETRGNEPKIDILIKLAAALNIDVNTLVGYHSENTQDIINTLTNYGLEVKKIDKYHVNIRPLPTLNYIGGYNPQGLYINKKRSWKSFNVFALQDIIATAETEAKDFYSNFTMPITRERVFYYLFLSDILEGHTPDYSSYEDYANWLDNQNPAPGTDQAGTLAAMDDTPPDNSGDK